MMEPNTRDSGMVILDTNCLIYSVENKLDLFESISKSMEGRGKYELVVPSTVINELMSMAGKKGKLASTALVAISLFLNKALHPMKTGMKADEWIKYTARELIESGRACYVCTYDRELKKNLKELGAVIVSLKR